jgi:hypothetical protein
MRFFFSSCRNKRNARETTSDKAKARVSKRIAASRSNAPDSPKHEIPVVPVELPPVVEKKVFFVENEVSKSESTISEQEDEKQIDLNAAPMTAEEDGRSAIVFAQDFVEELTDMVSEDASKFEEAASKYVEEKESYCCAV